MEVLNQFMNGLFDLLMWPCRTISPWPGVIVASLFSATIFVVLFQFTSDSHSLRRARNRFVARTLELLLFQHDLRVSWTACGRILGANAVYLGQFLRPMSIGLIPLILMFVQMECWFDRRPVHVGEPAVVTVTLDPSYSLLDTPVGLHVSEHLRADSTAVRIPATQQLSWRVVAVTPGEGWIDVAVAGVAERKSVVVSEHLARVSSRRVTRGWRQQMFAPSEPALAVSSPVRQIEIGYPAREMSFDLYAFPWAGLVVVLIMVNSLALARLLGIQIV